MFWNVLEAHFPIGSMYAIYGNIDHQYTPNVSIYTIHGSYGFGHFGFQRQPCPGTVAVFQALLRAARSVSKKSTSSETTQIAPREARCLGSLICTVWNRGCAGRSWPRMYMFLYMCVKYNVYIYIYIYKIYIIKWSIEISLDIVIACWHISVRIVVSTSYSRRSET